MHDALLHKGHILESQNIHMNGGDLFIPLDLTFFYQTVYT